MVIAALLGLVVVAACIFGITHFTANDDSSDKGTAEQTEEASSESSSESKEEGSSEKSSEGSEESKDSKDSEKSEDSSESENTDTAGAEMPQNVKAAEEEAAAEREETLAKVKAYEGTDPFWGAFAFSSKDEDEAKAEAAKLIDQGFDAAILSSTNWQNLGYEPWFIVTSGAWGSEDEALAQVDKLKEAGFADASAKETGMYIDGKNVVRLTVKTASGETLSDIVRRRDGGYVVPDSESVFYPLVTIREMRLTPAELCIAWNEPFARRGYHFKNPDLQAYFESTDWYQDTGFQGSLDGTAAENNGMFRTVGCDTAEGEKWTDLATS